MSETEATQVNAQITDSVTQVNTKVVGDTPAMAMGNLLMSSSHSLGNAGTTQQRHFSKDKLRCKLPRSRP